MNNIDNDSGFWSKKRCLERTKTSVLKGLIFGCLLLALGIFSIKITAEKNTPLVSDFNEYHAAKGGEFLEGGGKAKEGEQIKPAGENITGLMNWIFPLAITGIGLFLITNNTVDIIRLNRKT